MQKQLFTNNDFRLKCEKILSKFRYNGYYSIYPSFYSHFCKGIYSCRIIENDFEIYKHRKLIKKFSDIIIKQQEYIFNNREIVEELNKSCFKNIRNSYNYVLRKYSQIQIKKLNEVPVEKIEEFIYRWKEQHKHYWRLTYRRDIYLLEFYNELFGTIILDNDRVIGVEINYQTKTPGLCINIMRKHDTNYVNLHDFLKIEGCRTCLKKGFIWSNDCDSEAGGLRKYKNKFLGNKGFITNHKKYART